MTEEGVLQLINCALLKYPQNTEEQFDYLIQEAYQVRIRTLYPKLFYTSCIYGCGQCDYLLSIF